MSTRQQPAPATAIARQDPHALTAWLLACSGLLVLVAGPGTAFSIAGIGLVAAAAAIQPTFGLMVLAATLPFYLYPRGLGGLSFSIPELAFLASALGSIVFAVRRRLAGRTLGIHAATPLDRPIALLLLAALLSLLASEVLRVSLRDLRTLVLEPVAAYYLTYWFVSRRRLPWLVGALLAGGIAAALFGLYQYLFTTHVVAVEGALRMLGPYLSPNQMGLYMGRSLPLALAAALFVARFRPASVGATAVLASALALTFSVGAWLASLIAVATVVALWRPRAVLALAVGTAAVGAAILPVLSTERFSSHLSLSRGTSFIRLQLWESSLRMIQDHPLLGVGMDNFLYRYRSSYLLPEAAAEPNLSHPHNLILNFWLQIGILGLAAFVWLLATLIGIWRRLWKTVSCPLELALLAGVAGVAADFFAHGLVDNSYFLVDMAFHFWLLAGMVVSLHSKARIE